MTEITSISKQSPHKIYQYLGVGVLVGLLSGLLGVGGGILLVPILVGYFGVDQHLAHGTSLAVVVPTACLGAIIYGYHGSMDVTIAAQLAVGGIIGAPIGTRLMKKIPAAQLKRLFGIMLMLVGIRMVFS
jgi:uncharacterized membrane protein YfcA